MRWPWTKRPGDEEAAEAVRSAEGQKVKADKQASEIERKIRAAADLKRRTDRFAQEIERAWQHREST